MRNFNEEYNELQIREKHLHDDIQKEILKICVTHPNIIVWGSKDPNKISYGTDILNNKIILTVQTISSNLKTLNRLKDNIYGKKQ